MPKEVAGEGDEGARPASQDGFMSPEATVVRNYVDWLVSLPWKKETKDQLDIATGASTSSTRTTSASRR